LSYFNQMSTHWRTIVRIFLFRWSLFEMMTKLTGIA